MNTPPDVRRDERVWLSQKEFYAAFEAGQRDFSGANIMTDQGLLELEGDDFDSLYLLNARINGNLAIANVDMGYDGVLSFSGLYVAGELSLCNISGLAELNLCNLQTLDGLDIRRRVSLTENGVIHVNDLGVALTCFAYFGRGIVIAPELAARVSALFGPR